MSNYPPGVSGNEPQITGEWPRDPHCPWTVISTWEDIADEWAVQYMNDEELIFKINPDDWAIPAREAADYIAKKLNKLTAKQYCCINEHGCCTICGDIIPPDDLYCYLKPQKRSDGTYYWLASTSLS